MAVNLVGCPVAGKQDFAILLKPSCASARYPYSNKMSVESIDPLQNQLQKHQLRASVIRFHLEGKSNAQILRLHHGQNIDFHKISRTISRYYETAGLEDRKRPGRPHAVRTPALIKATRDLIRKNPARSARKLAKNMNVSQSTMCTFFKHDLGLKAYKKHKIHGLTTAQKKKRFERSKMLLSWRRGDEIIFSDEKLFLLQESHNAQNDRVWCASIEKIPDNKRQVQRFQNVSSVMVWGAISKRGKFPLVFIDKGVKINQQYYLEHVLIDQVLPNAKAMYDKDYYCFQQDGAPAHTAKRVQAWCDENLVDYIPKDEWPPSSPDLNPLDFCIWGYMQQQLGSKKINSIDGFKKQISKIWDEIPMNIVGAACDSFWTRLDTVRKAKGERFES